MRSPPLHFDFYDVCIRSGRRLDVTEISTMNNELYVCINTESNCFTIDLSEGDLDDHEEDY